ncbi:MAG: hypothetical protein L0228_04035 [Planctomycetes bacterium]|nr:hypothetical protein [Planctomycetota bacterium]
MNRREKMLALLILLLVAAWGAKSLYGRYQRALDIRTSEVTDAQKRLFAVNRKLAKGRAAVGQMQEWQTRSLPEDREKALTLYKAWLLEKAKEAGLEVNDINPSTRPSGSTAYTAIGYQIKATGSLSAVVAMLYEFYRSPQLHQVTQLQLSRPQGASQIQVSLDVEALSLPGAAATDKLPEGDSKRLKLASVDEYKKTLEDRDLVDVYTPPRDTTTVRRDPPAPPKFDDAEQAHFTAAVGPTGALQAWINVRTTGETLHLAAGEPLKVGAIDGKIVSIEQRSLVYESDGKKYRVALGESLRKGKELAADGSTASEKPAEIPES